MTSRNALRALLVASAILLFVDLGASSIWDTNEAFYVETPRQMVMTGDYISPSFNGQPRFNKPVLSYWIVAGFYKAFGVSVTSERLAIALGALLIVGATFVIGKTVRDEATGTLAALIVASAPRVMLWSRRIFIDIWFTSFLSLALMAFVLARAHPDQRRRWLVLMYVALGLATLTKGPVALLLPGMVMALELVTTGTFSDIRKFMLPVGLLIVAAIAAPWYVVLYQKYGWAKIHEFFIEENLRRYAETYGLQHRPAWFYLPVILTDLLPWSLFLPAAAWAVWRERRRESRLLLLWIAAFVGVFTFSSTKQDLYIFPVVPAVAVVIATVLTQADRAGMGATVIRWLRVGGAVTALELLAVGGVAIWVAAVSKTVPNLPQAAVVGLVLVLGGLLAMAVVFRGRITALVLVLGITAVVANWLLVALVMRPFEQFKPIPPMSVWLQAHASDNVVVANYKSTFASMTYYLGRPVTYVFDIEAMTRLVDRERGLYAVMQPLEYDELRHASQATLCVVSRHPLPLHEAKVSEMLSGRLPEVLLVGVKDVCR